MKLSVWVLVSCRHVSESQHFEERGLQPLRGRHYVSPKLWHPPTCLSDAKTYKNIIIIIFTAAKTSDLIRRRLLFAFMSDTRTKMRNLSSRDSRYTCQ